MENEILRVEGMSGTSCSKTIELAVGNLPGVTAVEADYAAGTVDLTYNPDLVTLEAIKNVIEADGFVVIA